MANNPGKKKVVKKRVDGVVQGYVMNESSVPALKPPSPKATTKSDADSWSARGVARRDFRSGSFGPEVPKYGGETVSAKGDGGVMSRGQKRKMRERWCKGKEGVEHVMKPGLSPGGKSYAWSWGSCQNCGMSWLRVSQDVREKYDPELSKQRLLAEKWCGEGHLYETEEVVTEWGGKYMKTYCVMCGKRKRKH